MPRPKTSARSAGADSVESNPEASPQAAAKVVKVRVIKKYPNRRLYDTDTSTYITLTDVRQLVMGGAAFVVRDAKTSEDLTRSILLQIILEEETGGVPMLCWPTSSVFTAMPCRVSWVPTLKTMCNPSWICKSR